MKRTLLAALLALPLLACSASDAQAQCSPWGGPCFRLFPGAMFHGPLYNYGPYEGYYPFAPYGPWDSQLRYTGPYPGQNCGGLCGRKGGCGQGAGCGLGGGCGAGGCGTGLGHGLFAGLHGRGDSACNSCGGYASTVFTNVFHRSHPLAHRGKVSTGSSAPVGCGTPVNAAYPRGCSGGCSASAAGTAGLESVSLVAAIEAPAAGRYVRER